MTTRYRFHLFLLGIVVIAIGAGPACKQSDTPAPAAEASPAIATVAAALPATASPVTDPPPGIVRDPAFTPLSGARAAYGIHEGAAYRIEVPAAWNGGLVMYAHGYRGGVPELTVSFPTIREHLVRNGYAWAASSYRMNGYRPDVGVLDTLALRELFIRQFGPPRWTVLEGSSMGGHVLAASLELHPGVYQGGLAECGAITGIGTIDYLTAFAAAAEDIGGVPLFDAPDAATFVRRVLNEWLPRIGIGANLTERGRAFESAAKYLLGGELPYWREGLSARMTQAANLLLVADPHARTTPAGRAVDTRGVVYQIDHGLAVRADDLNRDVRRFEPAPGARTAAENPVFADFSGRITVPVLSIHTTGDAFVPFSLEQSYRRKAIAVGTDDLLVQRAIRRPRHCQFEAAERAQAFDDLVAWMEHGVRPEGDDVLAADLSDIGLRWTTPLLPDDPANR